MPQSFETMDAIEIWLVGSDEPRRALGRYLLRSRLFLGACGGLIAVLGFWLLSGRRLPQALPLAGDRSGQDPLLVGAALAGVFLTMTVLREYRRTALLRSGVIVAGHVRLVALERQHDADTAAGWEEARVYYTFTGPDGVTYEGCTPRLWCRDIADLSPGMALSVVCDPHKPGRHEADILGLRGDPVSQPPALTAHAAAPAVSVPRPSSRRPRRSPGR